MNKYSIIATMDKKEENKFLKLKRYLPKRIYLYYMKKYGKTIYKENVYLGEKGDTIMLPFTSGEFDELDEDYRLSYIEKIIKEYDIHHLYVDVNLRKFICKIDETLIRQYGTILMYMMLPCMLEHVLYDHNIDRKEMRLIIIDSGDYKVDYVLNLLVNDLNYLKIFTDRPEYFNEFVDTIYDNTGLITEPVSSFSEIEDSGSVIIDLSRNHYRYSGRIVIDMESDLSKRQYQNLRNKNTRIIYDVKLSSANQEVDNELLGFYLWKNHPFMAEFLDGQNEETKMLPLQDITKELNLTIEGFSYLS